MHDEKETHDLRTRILDTFMERAKVVGVRAVSTDDLARTLSISKKTLYKEFRSKEEMVFGLLDRWELRMKAELPIVDIDNPKRFARANVDYLASSRPNSVAQYMKRNQVSSGGNSATPLYLQRSVSGL